MKWTPRFAVMSGLALILVTNAIALGGVVFNRHGEPDSILTLTQRELVPPYEWQRGKENSGLTAHLRWRVLASPTPDADRDESVYANGSAQWIDDAKLAALGFDLKQLERLGDAGVFSYRSALPRDVLVVLEMDGPAYAESVVRAERQSEAASSAQRRGGQGASKEALERERNSASRLFAVDAGLDRYALRAKYPDRSKFAIVRAQIRPVSRGQGRGSSGFITNAGGGAVNIPWEFRSVFPATQDGSVPPRGPGRAYHATVAFGQRLEPWLVQAKAD